MQQNIFIGSLRFIGRGADCACACEGREGRDCEGFSLYGVGEAPLITFGSGAGFGFLRDFRFSFCNSTSSRPRRSASVSIEVRSGMSCRGGLGCALALLIFACSLCCQQNASGGRNGLREPSLPWRNFEATGDAPIGRRHGRPEPVMPWHVVSMFFESERATSDSGVLGMNGILAKFR